MAPTAPWRWWQVWRRRAAPSAPGPAAAASEFPAAFAGAPGYRPLRVLGRGATAEVLLALHEASGQLVALKVFAFEGSASPALDEALARFVAEADASRRLRHPDIIAVLDAGRAQGLAWMAMEYVEGHDLSRYTAKARLLPEALVLGIGVRLARALAHAHGQGIVHRDIKPANVRVDLTHDVVKLGDFGVARLADAARTRTGLMLGTPAYMAPEVLAGGDAGPAADLHALAVMLYELLTGERPYRGDSLGALIREVAVHPVPPLLVKRPDLPFALSDLLARAMAKQPEARPAHARELADALERLRGELPGPRP